MAARITLARIQRAIERAGIPLELVRGAGYQYFVHDPEGQPDLYRDHSVMVCYLSQLTIEQWLAEARSAWAEISKTLS